MLDNNNNFKKYDVSASLLTQTHNLLTIYTHKSGSLRAKMLSLQNNFFFFGTRISISAMHRTIRCIPLFIFIASRSHNLHR